ncbi:MAG: acyl-CoA desaturase [Anaerolineales bacterium]|nr:acyl-CoA desaturase [Anaerolineales bacterium]
MSVVRWFDSSAGREEYQRRGEERPDWVRIIPFIFVHLACFGVIWVGWSPIVVIVAAVLYITRMFAITGFYHRYFSHRAFKTNRFWQFVFTVLGNASVQRGPLWWAAHHRHHHRYADQPEDPHSPKQRGFWWSHVVWLTTPKNHPTRTTYIRDWLEFPELVWINRFDNVVPYLFAISLYGFGKLLSLTIPELGTSGPQMLVWGFFISTVVLLHATCTINSLDHMIGTRRYETPDTSRNNAFLALITLGEGWHNNHHYYAVSARQGFFWWEIDITYYLLVCLSGLGIVRDLRPLPEKVRLAGVIQTSGRQPGACSPLGKGRESS